MGVRGEGRWIGQGLFQAVLFQDPHSFLQRLLLLPLNSPPDPLRLAMPGAREGQYGGGSQETRAPRLGHCVPGVDPHAANETSPVAREAGKCIPPVILDQRGVDLVGRKQVLCHALRLERRCAFKHPDLF